MPAKPLGDVADGVPAHPAAERLRKEPGIGVPLRPAAGSDRRVPRRSAREQQPANVPGPGSRGVQRRVSLQGGRDDAFGGRPNRAVCCESMRRALGVCVLISLLWYLTTINPLLEQRSVTADLRRPDRRPAAKGRGAEDRHGLDRNSNWRSSAGNSRRTALELDSAAHINKRIAVLTEFFADCTLHIDDVQTGGSAADCSAISCRSPSSGGAPIPSASDSCTDCARRFRT